MDDVQDKTRILCGACSDGNIEGVEEILRDAFTDINRRDPGGYTPLMWAVSHGHLDIVKRLLEVPDIKLDTALHMARKNNRVSIMNGYTALHYACIHNSVSIIQLICQDSRCSPAVINKKNSDGETALMIAVRRGHLDIVKELDREGTDFFTKDNDGRTLIEMARRKNKVEVLEYLIERPKVDSLKVIVAQNIARYVKYKADVEALEIPVTVRQYLAGFVDDEDNDDRLDNFDYDDDDNDSLDSYHYDNDYE